MRLTKIQVSKLFGVFDHTIELKLSDRITIIHGPNGFGKTAMLVMIQSLLGNKFSKLRRIPFERFSITMEDGRQISVTRKSVVKADADEKKAAICLEFEQPVSGSDPLKFTFDFSPVQKGIRYQLEIIDRHIDDLERIGPDTWVHTPTGRQFDLEEVIEVYGEFLPITQQQKKKIPEWLAKLPNEFDVRLIEAQRLLNVSDSKRPRRNDTRFGLEPAVSSYSKELANNIQEIQAKYGTFSQQLDSTFPNRVFVAKGNISAGVDELKTKIQELEQKRQRIIEAGLLVKEQHAAPIFDPQVAVDDSTKNILSLYSEDITKKLGVFDEIAAKVELFKELVNKRFAYKNIDIERQSGFRLQTFAGLPLLPTDLSSGEQHELVLLYELLFKTKPNALILIDEPELSLHVAWQVEFLKDLARVIKLSSFDVILATHSPQIINDRWDLTVELKGPVV